MALTSSRCEVLLTNDKESHGNFTVVLKPASLRCLLVWEKISTVFQTAKKKISCALNLP